MLKVFLVIFIVINLIWIFSQNSYSKQSFAYAERLVAGFRSSPTPSATPFPSAEIPIYNETPHPSSTVIPSPSIQIKQAGDSALLHSEKYVYQTYNNCGPATLSMLLDFYDINLSQQEIADQLRPYNNPQGYNDDKSVTLDELAAYSEQKGLTAFKRPGGDIDKLKLLITNGIPIITITWIDEKGGFGHYRIVKGFDENKKQIIQDDSIFGQEKAVSYDEFLRLWQVFNYDYLVIVNPKQVETVKAILGEDINSITAYKKSLQKSEQEKGQFAIFNQSVNHFYLGDYQKSVQSFEQVKSQLPFRLLWYQIEPILSYQKLKNYDQVFALTDQIIRSGDPSFSEIYQIRAEVDIEKGEQEKAKTELQKAILYNKNYQPAQNLLKQII